VKAHLCDNNMMKYWQTLLRSPVLRTSVFSFEIIYDSVEIES